MDKTRVSETTVGTAEPDAAANQDSGAMDPPHASSILARAVYAIVQESSEARILSLVAEEALMELGDKATLVLLTWDEARGDELAERLKLLMDQHAKGILVVGLVGGADHARRVLKKAKPMMTQVKVGQVHIDDIGRLWTRQAGPVKQALASFEETSFPSRQEWADLLAKSAPDRADFARETKGAMWFSVALDSRRPVVTLTLAGVILAVFGLEHLFGGTQSPPVLLRMGALSPEHVSAGEIWRLISCTFLHSGPMHVLLNTYVLWVLGSFLERLMGAWRFLVLYGLSCLGASLVSLMFLDGFSVGASGGVWGLLGAQAVLAWRPQGLLHRSMISGARRAATFNFVINLLNSFRPHVDMWAHFGGGAVGAVLLLSGVLTRGLPRLGELADSEHLDPADIAIHNGKSLRVAGSVVAIVLFLGLVLGVSMGRPWELRQPLEVERTRLPAFGFSLALPEALEVTPNLSEEPPSFSIGDLVYDPGAVIVTKFPGDLRDPAFLASQHAELVEALKTAPSGAHLTAGPDEVGIVGTRGMTVRYRYENGVEEELAFAFFADALVKVDTLRWPAFGDTVPQGYAVEVLESLQPLYWQLVDAFEEQAFQGDPNAQNSLAWLLATCQDPAYLDGFEAIEYAQMAVAQKPDNVAYHDTLAAAYARAGNFDEAVRSQERALGLLADDSKRQEFEQRLDLYKSGKAYTVYRYRFSDGRF